MNVIINIPHAYRNGWTDQQLLNIVGTANWGYCSQIIITKAPHHGAYTAFGDYYFDFQYVVGGSEYHAYLDSHNCFLGIG